MTPNRLKECLAVIRWSEEALADALKIERRLVEQWLTGNTSIPTGVASWVEALCFTHEASDLMRPTISAEMQLTDGMPAQKREHVPVYAYNLLRALGRGPVALQALFGTDDEGAVYFLVSRGLATREDGDLTITAEGRSIGRVVKEDRSAAVGCP